MWFRDSAELTALAPIGHLGVRQEDWGYPSVHCKGTVPNPQKTVYLRNDGSLPLKVCDVSHDLLAGASPDVLTIKPLVDDANPLYIAPGRIVPIAITANIEGAASYDANQPPVLPLSIRSSGGAKQFDLNSPTVARVQDPQVVAQMAALQELLCRRLHEMVIPGWRQLPFQDPMPFSQSDRVLEHVIVNMSGVPSGLLHSKPQFADQFDFAQGSRVCLLTMFDQCLSY